MSSTRSGEVRVDDLDRTAELLGKLTRPSVVTDNEKDEARLLRGTLRTAREKAEQGYNGYTNYATWVVSMWLDGNYDGPGRQDEALARAKRAAEEDDEYPAHAIALALQAWVQAWATDEIGQSATLTSDLLGWAVGTVEWRELAEGLLDTLREEGALEQG